MTKTPLLGRACALGLLAILLAMAAFATVAPGQANAIARACPEDGCPDPRPHPTPSPRPTYVKTVVSGYGERHYKNEHSETDASLKIEYRRSDNQPLRAYFSGNTHTWDDNWFDGFISVTQVNLIQDGYPMTQSPLHRLTACGTADPSWCSDRRDRWEDDVPLDLALYTLGQQEQGANVGLTVDVWAES